MSETREFKEELAFHPYEQDYAEPTREEIINAINSVKSIPNKDKLIEQMDDRVRLIKGMKVLKEGTYNGVFYPDKVLREGAESWEKNLDKNGITHKVKLEHGKSISNRVGHLIKSYYEDGWVKQDFLLTMQNAADMWDGGLLDDVSVRMRVGTDMENSTSKVTTLCEKGHELAYGPVAKYILGVGTDFVDNPACRTCGVNPEKEKILEELEELDEKEEELCGANSAKGSTLRRIKERITGNLPKKYVEERRAANIDSKTGKCKLSSDQDFGGCLSHADVIAMANEGLGIKTNYSRPVIYEAYRKKVISADDVRKAGYNPENISKSPAKGVTKPVGGVQTMGDQKPEDEKYLTEDKAEGMFTAFLKKVGIKIPKGGNPDEGNKPSPDDDEAALDAKCKGGDKEACQLLKQKQANPTENDANNNGPAGSEPEDGGEEEMMSKKDVETLLEQQKKDMNTELDAKFENFKKESEKELQRTKDESQFKELVKEYADYSKKCKDEFNLEELEKIPEDPIEFAKKQAKLEGELEQLKKRAQEIPNGEVPFTMGAHLSADEKDKTSKKTKAKKAGLEKQMSGLGFGNEVELDEEE